MATKKNPRNRPASWADVEKAKLDGYTFGVEFAAYLFMFAAKDKCGLSDDGLRTLFDTFEWYSEQIARNDLSYLELRNCVRDEYGFVVDMHPGLRSEANKRIN